MIHEFNFHIHIPHLPFASSRIACQTISSARIVVNIKQKAQSNFSGMQQKRPRYQANMNGTFLLLWLFRFSMRPERPSAAKWEANGNENRPPNISKTWHRAFGLRSNVLSNFFSLYSPKQRPPLTERIINCRTIETAHEPHTNENEIKKKKLSVFLGSVCSCWIDVGI